MEPVFENRLDKLFKIFKILSGRFLKTGFKKPVFNQRCSGLPRTLPRFYPQPNLYELREPSKNIIDGKAAKECTYDNPRVS